MVISFTEWIILSLQNNIPMSTNLHHVVIQNQNWQEWGIIENVSVYSDPRLQLVKKSSSGIHTSTDYIYKYTMCSDDKLVYNISP